MTDASFTAAGYAILIEDDPSQTFTWTKKSYAPVAYGSKTFTPTQIKMSIYAKEFLAIYFAFKDFGHIFWGSPQPIIILTDNKTVTRFFQTKIVPPPLWNACDYVTQFSFIIAHIPGKNNTAADYLSRLEADPKDKIVKRIREDIETKPIEINIQSSGIAEEEQIFYTEDDNETEEQIWERKKQSRNNTLTDQPTIVIESMSVNIPTNHEDINKKLQKTVQIVVEQSKDPLLLQIKTKLQNQEYSEKILAQDNRYRHYNGNMDRLILKEEVLTHFIMMKQDKSSIIKFFYRNTCYTNC